MYKWILRHREASGANLLDPRRLTQGFYWFNDSEAVASHTAYSEMISVSPSQSYQANGIADNAIIRYVTFYDFNKQYMSDINAPSYVDSFTVPSGAYYAILTIRSESNGQDPELASITLGLGSPYVSYYTQREVQAVYKKMGRGYDKQSNYQFYREKLDGNLKLVRDDYDYLAALGFDQKILIDIEDATGILPTYKGQFYKTDCKWDSDDRIVEIKTEPADDYTEILAGLDKTFNIIQKAPELQELTLRRRPIIQVYIPGDNVVTNILGGTYWEQEIQTDPIFDHSALVNTYKFANPKDIRTIPIAYGPGNNLFNVSTSVTGERIDASNGTIVADAAWYRSDYIRIKESTQYRAINSIDEIAYYDANKNFISGETALTDDITSPASAVWIRFSNLTTNPSSICMFNQGATALAFETYSSSLSLDVTGEYDANRNQDDGAFKLVEESDTFFGSYTRYKYHIVPINASLSSFETWSNYAVYSTGFTNYRESGVNLLPFNGVNGQTGSFYFTEYRIYVRYYTDKLDVRGTATHAVPSEDIVANNRNYRRVIGYNIDDFYIYDQFVTYPTKFGRVPEGTPNTGEYYKEFQVSVVTGLSNPLPVSSTNWRAVSLWFFNNLDIRYTEFIDGQDYVLRDSYPLHSVIQILLREIGSTVTHDNTPEYSGFLYSATNPLGGFTFLDFDGGTIATDYSGNLTHFLTPKSNIIAGEYDQPAQKSEVTLAQILNMLRDVYKVYWHVENGKLRLEHVSWYQKGGTYGSNIIGSDLTILSQPRNNKKWSFSENKWDFDKENMPERFEYGWMDDVSLPFEGNPIQIKSNYVQLGRVEDLNVNGITTDIDFIMGNPQEVSKDGLCLLSAVLVDGIYRVPFIEMDIGHNQEVVMQNGFLSWLYLHPKFHTYDLPADKVNINGEDTTLFNNNTRQKKQEVTYPASQTINPYQLVRTGLGDGSIDKLKIDMESRMIKATIKHDTE